MLLLRMTHMLISKSSCDYFHPSFPVKQVILFHFKPSMSCYAISANNIIPKKHTFQLWTLKRFQTIKRTKYIQKDVFKLDSATIFKNLKLSVPPTVATPTCLVAALSLLSPTTTTNWVSGHPWLLGDG